MYVQVSGFSVATVQPTKGQREGLHLLLWPCAPFASPKVASEGMWPLGREEGCHLCPELKSGRHVGWDLTSQHPVL